MFARRRAVSAPPVADAPSGATAPSASVFAFIFRHLARFRREFVAALAWSVLFVLVPMQVPLLAGMLVNGLLGQSASFYGVLTISGSGNIFWFTVIGLGVVAGAYGLTAYLSSYSVAELGRTFVREQQKDLIRKLDYSPMAFHQAVGSGELMSRVITDTESTRTFVTQVFFNTVQNVTRIAFPVVALALLDPLVGLVAVAILPFEWLLSRSLQARLRDASRTARSTKGRLAGAVKENLDGIETIQTAGAEEFAIGRVVREADQLATDQIRVRTFFGLVNGTTWALTSIGLALAWGFGGSQVLGGTLTVGALVAVTGYVAILYLPMQRFTSAANTYQTGMVAFERIREVLEGPSGRETDPQAPPLRLGAAEIEFQGVSFGYGDTRSLANVDLKIPGNRVTAIVGRNGSGKSTLLKLIARLYDPAEGSVRIDGQDLRGVRLDSLRAQVGFVPQSPLIFAGTIEENIRFGRPGATSADVEWAAQASGAATFIRRLDQGYRTFLGPGGLRLSGGEAQQVAIARALLRRPRVLLLDEPNSALDRETSARLFAQLTRLKGVATVVLVVHHLDGVQGVADEVVVMEGGRVVTDGSGLGLPARATAMFPTAPREALVA